MYLVFFTYTKSNRQGRVDLASAKPDPPRGLEGGNPLCVKIFLRKIFYQNDLRAFDFCIDSGVLKTTGVHVSGKADRAEELLGLRDTDTSLITFREK
jgi:hypothetical protein